VIAMGRLRLIVPIMAVLAIAASMTIGDTAANGVPSTKAVNNSQAITAETLKPAACAGITLTAILTGAGNITGTNANELIISDGTVNNKLNGGGGNDCIIGSSVKNQFTGGAGTDVCIGNGGGDTFATGETQL